MWNDLWQRNGSPVFHNYDAMPRTLPEMFKILKTYDKKTLFKPEFFERRKAKALDCEFVQVKPVAQFGDAVELGFNVGTRGNGYDKPHWPDDLRVEIVT